MSRLAAVWRTTAARLAVVFTLVFAAGLGLALGSVYFGTIAVVDRQAEETLDAEVRALAERFRDGGLRRLVTAIEARTGPEARGDSVYLLISPLNRPIAGNLNAWPAAEPDEGWVRFEVSKRDGEAIRDRQVRARVFDLPGGYRLLVGRDSEDLEAVRQRFFGVATWVALGVIALGLLTGGLLGRRVLARVARVAEAGERIAAGNLDRRVPVDGRGDEVDRLAEAVNTMLARIEALMQGTRIATDAISHDVRRPLTRVRAELDLALAREADGADAREAMGRALQELDGAVGILNSLLHLARAEAGVAGSDWQDLDLAALAIDAADLYLPVAEERGIALTVSAPQALSVRGERQLIAQAVANLIDNAIKYAPPGTGKVDVAVEADASGVTVTVSDNGPGIPAAAREAVTERFVRLDKARGGSGSGLGLSLVKAVARLHGGRLVLADASPGLAACLILPAAGA